jgi:pyruvate formate lyase activating enzyme
MRILNIQRMSTEDGPGLRTTVFFKGCPLKCRWCHNPESISPALQKEWIQVRCIGCGTCVAQCPEHALSKTKEGIVTDRTVCRLCLKCIETCPTGAMQQIGKTIDVKTLFREVVKDKAYFNGDGGVTLSGGEVLAQPQEASDLCRMLKNEKISVAIDTAGFVPYAAFEAILPNIDLILYDLKIDDSKAHKRFCGVDNRLIKDNLKKLSAGSVRIWIRTPIIPEATDGIDNIRAIAAFLKDHRIRYDRWELCAFNNLCKDKYHRLDQEMTTLVEAARAVTGETDKITFTGITRLKEEPICSKR